MGAVSASSADQKATRDGYGDALHELGAKRSDIVVLDADLSGSTKTNKFSKAFPDRFFNVGVAEQNLVGHAAGLALAGYVPFASSFAMFLSGRAWEVVRNSIVYPFLNVKLVASHGGITVGEDGASHQCIEDFATMRAIPEMVVICPSDYNETKQIIHAIADYKGPVYVRVGRPNLPLIERENYKFEIGKAEVMREGKDVLIIANGVLVNEAMIAVKELEAEGIQATLLNMATIKPIDKEAILKYAKLCGTVVTCEEHNVIGGLGSAVSEFLSEEHPVRVLKLGMKDSFGKSGTWSGLLDYFGLRSKNIVELAKKAVQSK
ncbi:transketolase family protein [Leptospira selangorensis]|uniref:Transketolase family protein n=1 Tax=Leptospira selangorensis TaxID=2484982 RepID=A0A4R9FY81_9LEPT|nr:transketolase family protein [Leptospira selangorensis]TGK03585.1 transketolase family protein [Leptospira selangorensis]TGM14030.1 transketolase family protein [Leptospira selangorensis]TGM27038.1 transketolase family protein [Leptospira selangorensis]